MANLPIPDEPTYASFTVTSSSTGPFPITFSLFAKADLRVSVGGVEIDQNEFTFTGTLIDSGYDGGSVTLNDAVANTDVLIWRDIAPARATDFAPATTVSVKSIDAALDRQMAIAQDHSRDIERSVLMPLGEGGIAIPSPADRAETILIFDEDGDPAFLPYDNFSVDPANAMLRNGSNVNMTDEEKSDFREYIGFSATTKDFVSDFGGDPDDVDGLTNAAALMAYNAWGRTQTVAGVAANLFVPPGNYNFNHQFCQGFLGGIKRAHWSGYGAAFHNVYDPASGSNFGYELPWDRGSTPDRLFISGEGKKFATADQGDDTVTLLTPAEASAFAVDDYVMVGCLDIQFYGDPPNLDLFQFVKVTAVNTGTGAVTFTPPLEKQYRSDFPDNGKFGAARMWQMENTAGDPWDIDHTFEGLYIGDGVSTNPDYRYIQYIGKKWTFRDCDLPGMSQTISESTLLENCNLRTAGEPDKLVKFAAYDHCQMQALDFQSSSIDTVTLDSCQFSIGLNLGNAKTIYVESCRIPLLSNGSTYGMNRVTTLLNCQIDDTDGPFGPQRLYPSQGGVEINGTTSTYSNGVIRLTKATEPNLIFFNTIPGAWVYLPTTAGNFPGNLGVGVVTSLTADATYIYITTTLPFATIPAWAASAIVFQRTGDLKVTNCTGCDQARLMSSAAEGVLTSHLPQPWEYAYSVVTGQSSAQEDVKPDNGTIIRFACNVIRAPVGPVAPKITFTSFNAVTTTAMDDPKEYKVIIDLSTLGQRTFTTGALTGLAGTDDVTLAGATQTTLLANRWITNLNWGLNYDPALDAAYESALVEVEMTIGTGVYRRRFGYADMVGVVGSLP